MSEPSSAVAARVESSARRLGEQIWENAGEQWQEAYRYYLNLERQASYSEYVVQESRRRRQFVERMANVQAEYDRRLADATLQVERQNADRLRTFREAEANRRAEYDRQVALINRQYEQATAQTEAYNEEVEAYNRIADSYNRVVSGEELSFAEQEFLLRAADQRPDLFDPGTGFLSSSQLREAITDPELITGGTRLSRGETVFSILENQGQVMGVTEGAVPSRPNLAGMSREQALNDYTYVCTCPDYTDRSYNSETGEASQWTSSSLPSLYGQRVCKHILAVWNQFGYITEADLPLEG